VFDSLSLSFLIGMLALRHLRNQANAARFAKGRIT
jgi:hypothetical protein